MYVSYVTILQMVSGQARHGHWNGYNGVWRGCHDRNSPESSPAQFLWGIPYQVSLFSACFLNWISECDTSVDPCLFKARFNSRTGRTVCDWWGWCEEDRRKGGSACQQYDQHRYAKKIWSDVLLYQIPTKMLFNLHECEYLISICFVD